MSQTSDNFRGATLMVASMACFVLNDTFIKLAADKLSIFQVMFLRGLLTTALLALIAWRRKELFPKLARGEWRLLSFRMVGELGATLCYLTALFNMPIANATAILQSLPLAITLGAAVFLGEPVGWRRYLAIVVGFAGVLIIVRPGSEGFNVYSVWALLAVVFIVLRDLSIRRLATHVPSIFVALAGSAVITLAGLVLSPTMDWQPVDATVVQLLATAAVFLVFAYLFSVMTMRVGEIGFVSPFRYTILVWAIVLGAFVFGDIPDGWTMCGSAVVIAMGIYTFYRERKFRMSALAVKAGD